MKAQQQGKGKTPQLTKEDKKEMEKETDKALKDPTVKKEVDKAWADSHPTCPGQMPTTDKPVENALFVLTPPDGDTEETTKVIRTPPGSIGKVGIDADTDTKVNNLLNKGWHIVFYMHTHELYDGQYIKDSEGGYSRPFNPSGA